MPSPLPTYRRLVSLVPESGIQFLDLGLNLRALARTSRAFSEHRRSEPAPDGQAAYDLHGLELDEATQDFIDRQTGKRGDPLYFINAEGAVEVFLDQWVPLPVLRKAGLRPSGRPNFAKGPGNWVRLRLVKLPEPDPEGHTHRLTVAIDTTIEPAEADGRYAAPTADDVRTGEEFRLAGDERDIAWLVNEPWLDEWLYALFFEFRSRQRKGRPLREEDFEYACEHLARYLTLLQVLEDAGVLPTLRLVDPEKYVPIDVDLIVDVGNSRTCGILVESHPDAGTTDLNNSYVLELRDLSRPERLYAEPFDSKLEFAKATFGTPEMLALSRRSGRRTEAFVWPTVARIGTEASRLAANSLGAEGHTGMSSPKRYLWDLGPRAQEWRFNRATAGDGTTGEPPVTSGLFVQFLNEVGTPLERLADEKVRRLPAFRNQPTDPAFRARYARSSLMMFVLAEIIMQALVSVNSPGQRGARAHTDIPRRLRRIILTIPPAMPLAERKIYRRWAEWARDTVWEALGWKAWLGGRRDAAGVRRPSWRDAPDIRMDWDEANAAQLIYLYNEITRKYQGDSRAFFALSGRPRPGTEAVPRESLRVATIDIGGGTTDLVITTYQRLGDGAAAAIRPKPDFREGFNVAGDDILGAVVERHVMRPILAALTKAGAPDAKALMAELFGGDFGGQRETERAQRRHFVHRVAIPVALALLRDYETVDFRQGNRVFTRAIKGFLDDTSGAFAYIDSAAERCGVRGFTVADVAIEANAQALDKTVRGVIGPILADLCEVVNAYDCDVLLLSGRPSRLPAVRGSVLAKLPLPADRIISLHRYRVGNWYPFRDAQGRIADPKTTAVMGAMLCALAEGQLEAFSLHTGDLRPRSTARYVGEMELSGQILEDKLFFRDLDLDLSEDRQIDHTFDFYAPIFVGFRQLPVERWPATPFYRLGFSSPAAIANARNRLPYRVTLSFTTRAPGGSGVPQDIDEGEFRITDIIAADGGPVRRDELTLRLQTLKSEEGYWLDTGILTIV